MPYTLVQALADGFLAALRGRTGAFLNPRHADSAVVHLAILALGRRGDGDGATRITGRITACIPVAHVDILPPSHRTAH